MIQHPIPQNVTSYQFRLIGDMTIKQFIFLSIGVAGAVLFYYSNLFFFFKWLLIILSAMSGFAVAFIPFEERPLDQWLINYIKAIYRPTYFVWRKQPTLPDYFTFTPSISPQQAAEVAEMSHFTAIRRQQGLSSYLTTLPQDANNELDARERATTQNFISLFQFHPSSSTSAVTTTPTPTPSPPPPTPPPASTTIRAASETPVTPAITSTQLPFPSTPQTPNVIVGMVVDAHNKIVPDAIVEVLDSSGLPARATKTNQLGQFFSTTPLKRGTYRINIDKPGLNFDTIELQLTGQIVEPLKIQAKN